MKSVQMYINFLEFPFFQTLRFKISYMHKNVQSSYNVPYSKVFSTVIILINWLHLIGAIKIWINRGSNSYLFRLRILSAWGLLMYCSTICFQRLRHSHPLKKLWTFLIFCISISLISSNDVTTESCPAVPKKDSDMYKLPVSWDIVLWTLGLLVYDEVVNLNSFFKAHNLNT